MEPLVISEDILPIGEFKTHASRVIRELRSRSRPVVITQNGRPAAVLVSPEVFDELTEHHAFVRSVRDGLADAEAGQLVDDSTVEAQMDVLFGDED